MSRVSTQRLLPVIILASLFVLLPESIHAHGAGLTLSSTTTDGLVVDVDYSDLTIEAERIGRFQFNLFRDEERTEEAEYTDLWVRITRFDDEREITFFAGGIAKQKFGGDGFSITFPDKGEYKLYIRYNDANESDPGDSVAEAEFPLDVEPNSFNDGSGLLMRFIIVMLASLGIVLLILGFTFSRIEKFWANREINTNTENS